MTHVRCLCAVLALITMGVPAALFVDVPPAVAAAAGHPLTDEDRVFLKELQDAVTADNRAWIADHVMYPITVGIGGDRRTLERADDFLAHYDEIMNQRVRDAILAERFETLFKNWQGAMIGRGYVWFYNGLDGSYVCREVRPPKDGISRDCTHPDPDRRWSPPRTGIIAINNDWVPPEERTH